MDTTSKDASEPVRAVHNALSAALPMHDEQDFADARRGFLGALEPGVVKDASGRVVWDNDSYAFLSGDAPETVNPSLWRQSRLTSLQGCSRWFPGSTRCAASTSRTSRSSRASAVSW